jgi:hypothetical protein
MGSVGDRKCGRRHKARSACFASGAGRRHAESLAIIDNNIDHEQSDNNFSVRFLFTNLPCHDFIPSILYSHPYYKRHRTNVIDVENDVEGIDDFVSFVTHLDYIEWVQPVEGRDCSHPVSFLFLGPSLMLDPFLD